MQPETVLHIFWHCVHTRKLWQDICQFIVKFIHNDFELFFKDVLFGIFTSEKQYGNIYFLCNLIILLAKYFIHKCKVMKVTPNFSFFQEDIKMYFKSLSTSCNKKAIKTLNVCSLFGICIWICNSYILFGYIWTPGSFPRHILLLLYVWAKKFILKCDYYLPMTGVKWRIVYCINKLNESFYPTLRIKHTLLYIYI